jgi:hypothetical protein
MKAKIFLLTLVCISLMSSMEHPIFISMAQVDYKTKSDRLEIAVKIFSDDLQKVISKKNDQTIEIGTDREHKDATRYIREYVESNFKIYNNNKELKLEYVGRELERKDFFAMWVYFKVEKVKRLKNLKLYDNILIDYERTQKNKISFRVDNERYRKFDTYLDHEEVLLFQ